ncbi:MAG TPA: hypothetical protein VK326_00325 [Solirubrobacterales bacterium]|nr:hypothetical protein [Solirubrobacterales bacterium]
MSERDSEHLGELAAEVALGIADGEERARALEHVADCAHCRARLERLSALADELLLLSPTVEPPAGFEGRVVSRVAPALARRPLWRRAAVPVAAAVATAALAAGAVWLALGNDRTLADEYRETLAVADGEYFEALPMELPDGERVGYAYGYQGRTSWVVAIVYAGVPAGDYRLEAITGDGRTVRIRELSVRGGHGSAGGALPVPYDDLAALRLVDRGGRELAEAEL